MTLTETTTQSVASAPVQPVNQFFPEGEVKKIYLDLMKKAVRSAKVGAVYEALHPIMRLVLDDKRLDVAQFFDLRQVYQTYIETDEENLARAQEGDEFDD